MWMKYELYRINDSTKSTTRICHIATVKWAYIDFLQFVAFTSVYVFMYVCIRKFVFMVFQRRCQYLRL